jgi:hypothetical protein
MHCGMKMLWSWISELLRNIDKKKGHREGYPSGKPLFCIEVLKIFGCMQARLTDLASHHTIIDRNSPINSVGIER